MTGQRMEVVESTAPESLEDRLARLSSAGEALPPDEWPALARLEADLWRELTTRDAGDPDFARDPGHPTLGTVRDWRHALLAQGLESLAGPLDEQLEQLVAREAESWRDSFEGEDLDLERLFDAREEAARLDREALLLRRTAGGELPLAGERARLRAVFARAVREAPPDRELRRRWSDRLVDFADEVLAATYELPPALAVRHLEILSERLSFHLDVVEPDSGTERTRLRRRWRKLRAERQERLLQGRLEETFGRKRVGWWEKAVALAILTVVALLGVSLITGVPLSNPWMMAIDSAACALLLWDFAYKLYAVRFSGLWFRRHFLTDLVPSFPVSFLHFGFFLRIVRLARIVQYLRLMMPVVRGMQALGFLARGLDRLARRYGRLLDHDLILFPTPQERRAEERAERDGTSAWTLNARVNRVWERTLLAQRGPEERRDLAELRLATLRGAGELPWRGHGDRQRAGAGRKDRWVADNVLERLAGVTSEELEGELGPEFVARVARAVRALAGSPMRLLPFLRSWLPRLGGGERDADVCASAARGLARRVRAIQHRLLGFADLHGTVTPAEVVGRVGAGLVRSTARPAYRLLLLAAAFGFLQILILLIGSETAAVTPEGQGILTSAEPPGFSLRGLASKVKSLFEASLILIGSVCFLGLGLGLWLQRIAHDASTFHDQVARAQFLNLTDSLKMRHLDADVALFDRRVFAPERRHMGAAETGAGSRDREEFAASVRAWLLEGRPPARAERGFDPIPGAVLVYRDLLDGALLTVGDARVANQLLGNLSLKRLRLHAQVMDKRVLKSLERLDIGRRKASLRGPYLWFQFLCQALSQGAARQVVEFNENALPLEDYEKATPGERARFEAWLARDPEAPPPAAREGTQQVTTAFTALNFLDDDPRRDAQVEGRFGPDVLRLLRRDRRALFRRVFGTYPLHKKPLEQRVLNLRDLYHHAFEGGRAFFVPLLLMGYGVRRLGVAFSFVFDAVRRIRKPGLVIGYEDRGFADFDAALRKIDRMRGPVVRASMRQRALFDVEYLGLALPTESGAAPEATWMADLAFLGAGPELREELGLVRVAAGADVGRLARHIEDGLLQRALDPGVEAQRTHLRALTVAYRADLGGLRSYLSAAELLEEVLDIAAADVARPRRLRLQWGRRRAFARWWRAHRGSDAPGRKAAWRAVAHDADGVARALDAWDELGADARTRGEELAAEVLRHPGRMTEPLVTLRSVQTLGLIDLRNYREHVWRVGRFHSVASDAGPELPV